MRFSEEYDGRPIRKVEKTTEKYQIIQHGSSSSEISMASLKSGFISVFLPNGYPKSVSEDYLTYQFWDTLQALASSLTGALATEAVLRGAGVGDQNASALAASLTWLVKDGLGMMGRITFTYLKGSDLDANPKRWRLMADILNDASFFVDLLLPYFPALFLPLACTASLFRCVVGVAGGATRTAITQHQALRNNLADVAAKDGSQETLVNIVALLLSLILLPAVSGKFTLIWLLFIIFTFVHLFANYQAVRCLQFASLNRNRATTAIRSFLLSGSISSVLEANEEEPLFWSLCGTRHLGCSLKDLLEFKARMPKAIFVETEGYTLIFDASHNVGWVAMRIGYQDELLPFFHLECLRLFFLQKDKNKLTEESIRKLYSDLIGALDSAGFDSKTLHLRYDAWRYKQE